jgi:CDP-glycerol glycerophosphotransferase
VFTSFGGHYSDSPRYISEAIHKLSPETELVWLVLEKYLPSVPDYAVAVDINSPRAKSLTKSARAVVDNVYGTKSYMRTSNSTVARLKHKLYAALIRQRRQLFFTTWHGTPLKRMGKDVKGSSDCGFSCPNSTMILGNRFTLDIMDRLTFGAMEMQLLGCPRNDLMFCDDEKRSELKARLGLPADKKVVLYAPTFRTDGSGMDNKNIMRSGVSQINEMDFDRLFSTLSERFGGDFALVCRFHYHVEKMVDFASLEKKFPGKIINGNLHDDMAEYLAATDVLITDASSSMFDFALTGRPVFLLFPDLDNYRDVERGFYRDIDSLPFPCSRDFAGMLSDISAFDEQSYSAAVGALISDFGYVDSKDSSERVAQFILERCNK